MGKAKRRVDRQLASVARAELLGSDRSWMRWARCRICGEKYCVNNNDQQEVRPWRIAGVAVCAHCYFRKGAKRCVAQYKVCRDLANLYEGGHDSEETYRRELDRIMREAWDATR